MDIYWERQQGNNCRIHSLNAMFGHKFLDESKFKLECSEYDKIVEGLNSIDMDGFAEGMPIGKGFTMDDAKELMQAVQMYGMKNEEFTPDKLRELYEGGFLYKEGDLVESLSTGLVGEIHRCGANHLIVVTEDNIMFKSFIHDVQAI